MGATTSGGSVVETIRQQLSAGYSGDQVVEGLMAGGLSRPSAERFVQRAGGHVTSVAPPPIPAHGHDAPPPMPVAPALVVPPPVPADYQAATEAAPFEQAQPFQQPPHFPKAQPFQQTQSFQQTAPFDQAAPAAPARTSSPMNGLKLAGGAALLLVGVALLALSLSASGRVRLKLPLALVLGGGVTLVQAIRER